MSYFNKLPTIEYNGQTARNITARVSLSLKTIADTKQYQTYTIPEGMRADELAYDYYRSPSQSWLLYLANNITDPYYQWPMNQNILDDFIANKYGSSEIARENIHHYRVNWAGDTTKLTKLAYDSLTGAKKYYWTVDVETDVEGIVSYKRKPIDTMIQSNKIIEYVLDSTAGLIVGEKIKQGSNSAHVAAIVDSTTILGEKVTGTLSAGAVVSSQTETTLTLVSSNVIGVNISETAPDDVSIYWEPVSCYDYEFELNALRQKIFVIDSSMQTTIDRAVTGLLQNE